MPEQSPGVYENIDRRTLGLSSLERSQASSKVKVETDPKRARPAQFGEPSLVFNIGLTDQFSDIWGRIKPRAGKKNPAEFFSKKEERDARGNITKASRVRTQEWNVQTGKNERDITSMEDEIGIKGMSEIIEGASVPFLQAVFGPTAEVVPGSAIDDRLHGGDVFVILHDPVNGSIQDILSVDVSFGYETRDEWDGHKKLIGGFSRILRYMLGNAAFLRSSYKGKETLMNVQGVSHVSLPLDRKTAQSLVRAWLKGTVDPFASSLREPTLALFRQQLEVHRAQVPEKVVAKDDWQKKSQGNREPLKSRLSHSIKTIEGLQKTTVPHTLYSDVAMRSLSAVLADDAAVGRMVDEAKQKILTPDETHDAAWMYERNDVRKYKSEVSKVVSDMRTTLAEFMSAVLGRAVAREHVERKHLWEEIFEQRTRWAYGDNVRKINELKFMFGSFAAELDVLRTSQSVATRKPVVRERVRARYPIINQLMSDSEKIIVSVRARFPQENARTV